MELSERKLKILKSIVDEYIKNGEPVGSKHLVESGNMSLSSATIRNEMSELEELGYLDKPHTSAGRIPSSAAYRIYIEQLMENYRLGVEEINLLNELTRYKMEEMEKFVTRATKIISEITNCATLSLMTSKGKHIVKRFDALLVDKRSLVLVMVLPDEAVKTRHLVTDVELDAKAVEIIKAALNKHLCGVSLDDVSLPLLLELEGEFGPFSRLVTPIVKCAYEAVCEKKESQLKINGITNLLSYPEFMDVGKVKSILSLVEKQDGKIKEAFENSNASHSGLRVYIGEENRVEELNETSVVYCTIPIGDGQSAVIGILGPKRMDYKKVISALHQLSDSMDIKKLPGGDNIIERT